MLANFPVPSHSLTFLALAALIIASRILYRGDCGAVSKCKVCRTPNYRLRYAIVHYVAYILIAIPEPSPQLGLLHNFPTLQNCASEPSNDF